MILFRFCSALLSAYIFSMYLLSAAFFLWKLSPCAGSWEEAGAGTREAYEKLAVTFNIIAGCLWVAAWAYLEFLAHRSSERQKPRLLTHLRYGPLAVLLFSFIIIIFSDLLLIQYSRWQIVRYIHSDASPQMQPSFNLHNNYRHWCGNGVAANEYALYGEAPAEEYDSPDPATRARALQASIYVYDWINNPQAGPSIDVLKKAINDPDPLVRNIAEKYHPQLLGIPSQIE